MHADLSAASLPKSSDRRRADLWLLLGLMLLAAALRLPYLGHRGYLLDEAWTAELAAARGSVHLFLPMAVPLHPPDLFTLVGAPPWWRVWTTMQCTHPPLYFLLLRLWMNAFGQGDAIERSLSVLCSVIAVGFLFDSARMLNGRTVAIWAALLMAVAPTQIDYARQTRNYAMELAAVLAATDALVRIEVLGLTRRRLAGLAVATLVSLLTHYFCVAFLGGLGIYALIRLRGRARLLSVGAFAAAALAFLICWGPFMWQQRTLFSTSDVSTVFLQDSSDAPAVQSIKRALLVPFRMLAQPQDAPPGSPDAVRNQASTLVQLAVGLGVLYALPFILRRRQPGLLLWGVCLACTVGLILGMDLARQTCHLSFIRYVLLAGPPVYVLIPATAAAFRPPWLRHLLPAAAMGASLLAINQGYHLGSNEPADAHTICNYIRRAAQPRDFFIFLATGDSQWQVFATYPVLARYLRPFPGPIAFENTWLSPPVLRQAMARRRVFVAAAGEDARLFLPQLTCVGYASYYGDCDLWVMAHPRSQPHPEPHPEPQTQLH